MWSWCGASASIGHALHAPRCTDGRRRSHCAAETAPSGVELAVRIVAWGLGFWGITGCAGLPQVRHQAEDWPVELRTQAHACSDRINAAAVAYDETSRWEFWTGLGLGGAGASLGAIGVAADDSDIGSWTAVGLGLLAAGRQIALSQGWLDTEEARGRYDRARGRLADAEDHRADAGRLKRAQQVVHLDMKQTIWQVDITDRGQCADPVVLKGQWTASGTARDCKAAIEVALTTSLVDGLERRFLEGSNPAPIEIAGPDGRCSVQLACLGAEDYEAWQGHVESLTSSLIDCVRDPSPEPEEGEETGEETAEEAVEEAPEAAAEAAPEAAPETAPEAAPASAAPEAPPSE
jgi:hypothetical protein